MAALHDPTHIWTPADFDDLPPEWQSRRLEIVDGALVVSPSPVPLHQYVLSRLLVALAAATPPGLVSAPGPGTAYQRTYREPDLVVADSRAMAADHGNLDPTTVFLAVEIVSPSSRTTDRITKRAEYASVGIANYWRVELEPDIALTASALQDGAYVDLGTWRRGETAHLTAPFDVRLDIEALVPPINGALER